MKNQYFFKRTLLLACTVGLFMACQPEDGMDGAMGPQGIQGIQGEQGPQGLQGEQGEQGPAGEDGTVNIIASEWIPFELENAFGFLEEPRLTYAANLFVEDERITTETLASSAILVYMSINPESDLVPEGIPFVTQMPYYFVYAQGPEGATANSITSYSAYEGGLEIRTELSFTNQPALEDVGFPLVDPETGTSDDYLRLIYAGFMNFDFEETVIAGVPFSFRYIVIPTEMSGKTNRAQLEKMEYQELVDFLGIAH